MYSIPTWSEEARALHNDICRARASESPSIASELRAKLQLKKKKLLQLLDDCPRNSTHREAVNQGKAYIHSVLQKITPEFTKKILFLSNQLNINEHVAATLLKRSMEETLCTKDNIIDTAIVLYHQEHEYLLECFEVILVTAKDATVDTNIRLICYDFMSEVMQARLPINENNPQTTISFLSKVLSTAKRYQQNIQSITESGGLSTAQTTGTLGADMGQGKLGEEITDYRIQRMVEERIGLFRIFYHLSALFWPECSDVMSLMEELEKADLRDYATPYMIIAMIAALSPENHVNHNEHYQRHNLSRNHDFLDNFYQRIISRMWMVPAVKATIVLQWLMLLEHAAERVPSVKEKFGQENLSQLMESAISAKAFVFMNNYMLQFQQEYGQMNVNYGLLKRAYDQETDATEDIVVDTSDFTLFNSLVRDDFQMYILHELDILATTLTKSMQNVLQTLKYREEDSTIPEPSNGAPVVTYMSPEEQIQPCNDLENYFTFLASVYRYRLDAGFQFWTNDQGGLFSFTQWATSIKVPGTVRAVYDFLGSISTGERSATCCHAFMNANSNSQDLVASNLFSWGKLVSALQFYRPLLCHRPNDRLSCLSANEESLLMKFLYLLKQTVLYSMDAREFLWVDAVFSVKDNLIDMISSPTSTDLRASLYNVFVAFCSPGVGCTVGKKNALEVWSVIERGEIFVSKPLNEKMTITQAMTARPVGFLSDLALEQANGAYPETLAVIELLVSLIHTPHERNELVVGFKTTSSSIPLTLGCDRKNPGAGPYISLILDNVFLKLDSFKYLHSESQWQLVEACLRLIENSILSFDLKPLVYWWRGDKTRQQKTSVDEVLLSLLRYITHPGFEVLVRLFSGSSLCDKLFQLLITEADAALNWKTISAYSRTCIARCLSIINRALEVQDAFCNLLVPTIQSSLTKPTSTDIVLGNFIFKRIPSLAMLSHLMLHHRVIIAKISLLVNSKDYEEISSLSTKIIQTLSTEPTLDDVSATNEKSHCVHLDTGGLGRNLTMVLQTSEMADAIVYGFSERLLVDYTEAITFDDCMYDFNNVPFWRPETIANNIDYLNQSTPRRPQSSIRLSIIDLLLKNSIESKSSPTLAEFLLGFKPRDDQQVSDIKDPHSSSSTVTSFHSVLDLLRSGVKDPGLPLVATHPILAEKCYQLIYHLCLKASTSEPVMRYLRTRENFFNLQFKAMPSRLTAYTETQAYMIPGAIVYPDGETTTIDFFSLRSQLLRRAWLLKSVALELHVSAMSGRTSDAGQLLELLYGDGDIPTEKSQHFNNSSSNSSNSNSNFHQPLVKMFEILSSLNFTWKDEANDTPTDFSLEFFETLDVQHFEVKNEHGCIVFDIWSVYMFLRGLQRMEAEAETERWDAMEHEIRRIIHILVTMNHEREIVHAKACCLEAWKQVVEVSFSECQASFQPNRRAKAIYNLLQMLLPSMRQAKGNNDTTVQGISQIVMMLMSQVKFTGYRETTLTLKPGQTAVYTVLNLPTLGLSEIFLHIAKCIQDGHSSVTVRGNMYISLVELIRLTTPIPLQPGSTPPAPVTDLQRFIAKAIEDAHPSFLEMIYNDTIYSDNIWKTAALAAMNALYTLTERTATRTVLHFLEQRILLFYRLGDVFESQGMPSTPRTHTISPINFALYDAKMTMLSGIATEAHGAALLCTRHVFDELCKFNLNSLPQGEKVDNEMLGKLVTPLLELVNTLLCSGGHPNEIMVTQTKRWMRVHQDLLKYILNYKSPRTPFSETQWTLAKDIICLVNPQTEFFNASEAHHFDSLWHTL